MRSRLSILGLYRFDEKIFDGLEVPQGVTKSLVVNKILLDFAELEILYPDWDMMHFAIGQWSKRRLPVWTKLYATTSVTYDPIANYDRREEWSDSGETSDSGTTSTTTNATVSGVGEMSTAGYNTDAYKPHDKNETSGTDSRSGNSTTRGNGTSSSTHTGRVWGNIGVTSTQQLIEQERSVSEFDMVKYIADDFANEFCLMVY